MRHEKLSPQSEIELLAKKGEEKKSTIKETVKKGVVIAVITAIMVGLRPFFVQSLTPNHSLFQILISNYLYAFFILLIFKWVQLRYEAIKGIEPEKGSDVPLSRKVKLIFLAMLFGHLLSNPIHYAALSFNDATSTETIHKTTPIFLLFAAAWVGQEKVTKKKIAGVFLVILGALLVVSVKETGAPGSFPLLGKILALVSAITFVGSDLVNKVIVRDKVIKNYNYLLLAYGVGSVLLFVIGGLMGMKVLPIFNFWILLLAGLNVLVWVGKFEAAHWLEASRIRGIVSTSPVATVLIGMVWFWSFPDPLTGLIYLFAFASFYFGIKSLSDQSQEETLKTIESHYLEQNYPVLDSSI